MASVTGGVFLLPGGGGALYGGEGGVGVQSQAFECFSAVFEGGGIDGAVFCGDGGGDGDNAGEFLGGAGFLGGEVVEEGEVQGIGPAPACGEVGAGLGVAEGEEFAFRP